MKKYLQKNLNKSVRELINTQNENKPQNKSINRILLNILSQNNKINMQKINSSIIHIPNNEKVKEGHQLSNKKFPPSLQKNNKQNLPTQKELNVGKDKSCSANIALESLQKLKQQIFFSFGTAEGNAKVPYHNPTRTHTRQISSTQTTVNYIHPGRSPKKECSYSRLRTIHSIKPSPQITPKREKSIISTPAKSIKGCRPSQQSHQSREKRKFIEVMSINLTPSRIKAKIEKAQA